MFMKNHRSLLLAAGLLIAVAGQLSAAAACCAPEDAGAQATAKSAQTGEASKATMPACCARHLSEAETASAEEGQAATADEPGHPVFDAYTRMSEAMVADDLEQTRSMARALRQAARQDNDE